MKQLPQRIKYTEEANRLLQCVNGMSFDFINKRVTIELDSTEYSDGIKKKRLDEYLKSIDDLIDNKTKDGYKLIIQLK